MENKAHALMAGIFTIALLIAAALIAMWFNRDREERTGGENEEVERVDVFGEDRRLLREDGYAEYAH